MGAAPGGAREPNPRPGAREGPVRARLANFLLLDLPCRKAHLTMLGGFHYLSFARILSCRMSVFNDLRGFSGKRKNATFVRAKSGRPSRRERASWKARPLSYGILQKHHLALFLNLAIGNSWLTSEKAKHRSAHLARECRFVRSRRGKLDQNPTLGFHVDGPESTERSFLLTTTDARNWGTSPITKPRPSRLKEARDLFT